MITHPFLVVLNFYMQFVHLSLNHLHIVSVKETGAIYNIRFDFLS